MWIVHWFVTEVPSGNEEVKSKGVRKGEAERRGEGDTGETPLANGRLAAVVFPRWYRSPWKILIELRDMISLLALQNATQN